jgi:replication initiator protein
MMRFMGEVHKIIEDHGKQAAVTILGADRSVVEAAAAYMGDPDSGVGFLYSGLCQAALPHRQIPDDQHWEIKSEHVSLLVEPGRLSRLHGPATLVGVPYGSRARLIMLYLQSEAMRTGKREVRLGRSMRDWMTKMGVASGGKSIVAVRDQARRISLCRLSFQVRFSGSKGVGVRSQSIVDTAFFLDYDDDQETLFPEEARLSPTFFEELQQHCVPLEEPAIRAINNNSMALDLYAWAAFRLHALKAPVPISWTALKGQFGTGFQRMNHFRATFLSNLELAMAVYPDARIDVTQRGLTLRPSPPPVRPKLVAVRA